LVVQLVIQVDEFCNECGNGSERNLWKNCKSVFTKTAGPTVRVVVYKMIIKTVQGC
jgi:hypothetical protein